MSDFNDDSKTPTEELDVNHALRLERMVKALAVRFDDRDFELKEARKLFYEVTFGPLSHRVEWNSRMI